VRAGPLIVRETLATISLQSARAGCDVRQRLTRTGPWRSWPQVTAGRKRPRRPDADQV